MSSMRTPALRLDKSWQWEQMVFTGMRTMNQRPHSITIIAWIFILVGCVAFAYHVTELDPRRPFEHGLLWVCFVRILALVAGIYLLSGCNWARWLLVVWI